MARLALAVVFIGLPLLELGLLIKTGQVLGFWATLGMLAGAGLLGALILSRQSLSMLRQAQEAVARGRPPVAPVLDGVFLLLAGALLITPGFLTDILGLLLLVPPIRHAIARWSVRRVVESAHARVRAYATSSVEGDAQRSRANPAGGTGPIIEGEFERLDEKQTTRPHRPNGHDRV
jgi:UPF0716 protein FxsA